LTDPIVANDIPGIACHSDGKIDSRNNGSDSSLGFLVYLTLIGSLTLDVDIADNKTGDRWNVRSGAEEEAWTSHLG
jgi:hypothetical protein